MERTATITVVGQDEAPLEGQAIDGYIEGATVFGDANNNGDLDTREDTAPSRANVACSTTWSRGHSCTTVGVSVTPGVEH